MLIRDSVWVQFETTDIIDQTGGGGGEQVKVPVSVSAPQMESTEGEVVEYADVPDELD